MRRAACLAATAVTLPASSCDGRSPSAERTAAAIPLGSTPAPVLRLCRRLQRGSEAECPSQFPRRPASHVLVESLTPHGYRGYLASFNIEGFSGDDVGHVILGSQPRPLPLRGRPDEPWPSAGAIADPQLKLGRGLRLLRHVRVGGAAGLALRAPPYPAGGVHGGHVLVVWNSGGRGYLVSLHFADRRHPTRYPELTRLQAALAIAQSMRRTR